MRQKYCGKQYGGLVIRSFMQALRMLSSHDLLKTAEAPNGPGALNRSNTIRPMTSRIMPAVLFPQQSLLHD